MGGGGAGGFLTGTITVNSGTVYSVDVGAGGTRNTTNQFVKGGNGGDSILSGADITTVTAVGGGTGGTLNHPVNNPNYNDVTEGYGEDGGSGGGACSWDSVYHANPTLGGSGTTGQGNDGGDGTPSDNAAGSGGGGAGSAGGANSGSSFKNGGAGGNGKQSSITGTLTYYSAGTGGGKGWDGSAGTTGSHGTGYTGNANTGDAGEAGIASDTDCNGNSGVVILKIPSSSYSGTTVGSPNVDSSSVTGYHIVKFTGDGSYTG